jgi:hypothetical protein
MSKQSMTYQSTPQATWRLLDQDKSIVLDLTSGRYYSLNKTGTLIWQWMTRHYSVETMVSHLAASCAGDAGQLEADVTAFLSFLTEQNLIAESGELSVSPTAGALGEIASGEYVKPQVIEHEALKQVVASGSDDYSSTGGSSHYWYPC